MTDEEVKMVKFVNVADMREWLKAKGIELSDDNLVQSIPQAHSRDTLQDLAKDGWLSKEGWKKKRKES